MTDPRTSTAPRPVFTAATRLRPTAITWSVRLGVLVVVGILVGLVTTLLTQVPLPGLDRLPGLGTLRAPEGVGGADRRSGGTAGRAAVGAEARLQTTPRALDAPGASLRAGAPGATVAAVTATPTSVRSSRGATRTATVTLASRPTTVATPSPGASGATATALPHGAASSAPGHVRGLTTPSGVTPAPGGGRGTTGPASAPGHVRTAGGRPTASPTPASSGS